MKCQDKWWAEERMGDVRDPALGVADVDACLR